MSYTTSGSNRTFIFAGGGTGGHLYPGLAIAEALRTYARAISPNASPPRCLFICSDRPLDREILTREQVEFIRSPAKPITMRPKALVRFMMSWGPAIRQARETISQARTQGDVHLVAMGGFVAAPAVQAARAERIPVTLVNLDAVPGKANLWIARRTPTKNILTAAKVSGAASDRARAWTFVPPIVRAAASNTQTREACLNALGLDPVRRTLMVTGGSQGAKSLNNFVAAFATGPGLSHFANGGTGEPKWQILHQTGKGEREAVAVAYQRAGIPAVVEEFVNGMSLWWGAADLAIARAGAGNVAEAWANRVPSLFLPYPYHRDEHQKFNAAALVEAGAAWLAKDHIAPETNLAEAGVQLSRLMQPNALDGTRAAFDKLGPADGADRVAKALLSLN